MRVITGSARGRRLETMPGEDVTRPTSESVKEALFSMIQFEIEGKRVLDLLPAQVSLELRLCQEVLPLVFLLKTIKAQGMLLKEIYCIAVCRTEQVFI